MRITAAIEVPADQKDALSFEIKVQMTNTSGEEVSIPNPDMGSPSPEMKWPFSQEAYQVSTLISFHFLTISVTDEDGQVIPSESTSAWAIPALKKPLILKPGGKFEVTSPLGTLYRLPPGKRCEVAIVYGDQNKKVEVQGAVAIPG